MGFLQKSGVTNSIVGKNTSVAIASAQRLFNGALPQTSNQIRSSINSTLGAASFVVGQNTASALANSVNSGFATVNSTLAKIAAPINLVSNVIRTADRTIASVKSTIGSIEAAARSISGIFDKSSSKGLASGISPNFTDIFKDNNSKIAANVISKISDPVSTLMAKKAPIATSFKVDSLDSSSKSVGMGAESTFGSGDKVMIGVVPSTLLDRFNLDLTTGIPAAVNSASKTSKLNGLFSNIGGTLREVNKVASQVRTSANIVSRTAAKIAQTTNSVTNDFDRFKGDTTNLSTAFGGRDLSSYFTVDKSYSLVDRNNISIKTNNSGIDAYSANAIVAASNASGCTDSDQFYTSASDRASLYAASIDLAAQSGMTTEVENLLACSHASSPLGQSAIANAFVSAAGSQLALADTLIDGFNSPSILNTTYLRENILTNPDLSSKDVGLIKTIFGKIGAPNDASALSLPDASTFTYPVMDSLLLNDMQPGVVDEFLGDKTITSFLSGTEMYVGSDGVFTYS